MKKKSEKREIPIQGPEDEVTEKSETAEKPIIDSSAAAKAYQKQDSATEGKPAEAPAAEEKVATPVDEVAKMKDRYLRLQAEFDNFRKRSARERQQIINRATMEVVEDVLPVLDNFKLALGHDAEKKESFRTGVEMIFKQLQDVLTRHGVEPICPVGKPFDPNFHEALMTEPSDDVEEGHVLETLQDGYMLKGAVLRPARVKVSSGAPEVDTEDGTAGPDDNVQ